MSNTGKRVIVTGQVGIDKTRYVEAVSRELTRISSQETDVAHVGPRMYREDPSIPQGKILWLDRGRLSMTRRAVFRDIIREAQSDRHLLVNTHATFRWHHGLFPALDPDLLRELNPDLFVTVIDNLETIHGRLKRDHSLHTHKLHDILMWREEEMMAAEIFSQCISGPGKHLVIGRGRKDATVSTLARLIHDPAQFKVYPSFPMTHVKGNTELLAEIDEFRAELAKDLICFDPGEVDEFELYRDALEARDAGKKEIAVQVDNQEVILSVDEIISIGPCIEAQIVARDYKLIDQSDMIVSLIPEIKGGLPALSSGVERELDYAHTNGKEAVVIWKPARMPSPFITANATQVVRSVEEARQYLISRGVLKAEPCAA